MAILDLAVIAPRGAIDIRVFSIGDFRAIDFNKATSNCGSGTVTQLARDAYAPTVKNPGLDVHLRTAATSGLSLCGWGPSIVRPILRGGRTKCRASRLCWVWGAVAGFS